MATAKQTKLPLEAKNKPVKEFRSGSIRAVVWLNSTDNGEWYSTTLSRSYKSGENWQETNQFNRDDLLVVSKLAELAYHFITQPKT
jgi:hypothetical protein